MPNDIIYINGPSSAGKTTLARVLQDLLPEPYLYVNIDTLIELMPPKTNDWSGERDAIGYSFQKLCDESGQEVYRVVAGPYGAKVAPAFRAMTLALARSGLKLIIDDIAFGDEQVQHWRETLRGFAVLWVGVTADAETLLAREAARGDRLVGSARDQRARPYRRNLRSHDRHDRTRKRRGGRAHRCPSVPGGPAGKLSRSCSAAGLRHPTRNRIRHSSSIRCYFSGDP